MIFHSSKISLTGLVSSFGLEQYIDIPINLKAKLGRVMIQYITLAGQYVESATPRNFPVSVQLLSGVTEASYNMSVGAITSGGFGGAVVATSAPVSGILLTTDPNGSHYDGPKFEIDDSFTLRVTWNSAKVSAVANDYWIYLTIGYV